jgi:prepilin-type N-terminal cleavage/methylation domain-containing protein
MERMSCRLQSERGFTLLEILVVVAILGVLAVMAVVRLSRAKLASNEASAISSLRVINSAEATFAASCGGEGYAQSLEGLATPPSPTAQSFISADLTTTGVVKSGYFFTLQADAGANTVLPAARTCNNVVDSVSAYFAFSDPQVPGTSGRRTFATDKNATIFYRADGMTITSGMPGALPID